MSQVRFCQFLALSLVGAGLSQIASAQALDPSLGQNLIDKADLQFAQKSAARDRLRPPVMLPQVAVHLKPGVDVRKFAAEFGLRVGTKRPVPNAWILQAVSPERAQQANEKMQGDPRLKSAFQDRLSYPSRHQFVPNDPFFAPGYPSPAYAGQWHLLNSFGGVDIRVRKPWLRSQVGTGVVVGVVDDSLQTLHPDLIDNISSADSWDFGQGDNDPSPVYDWDAHGTSVAGVIAARGGNGIGTTGVAPRALLAGLRCDFGGSESQFVDATAYRANSIPVKNHSYGWTTTFYRASPWAEVWNTSATTVHVYSAGNARGTYYQDCTKTSPNAEIPSITVAALNAYGQFAEYSSFGSAVTCTAPSSSMFGPNVMTTDRTGDFGYESVFGLDGGNYTDQFGGTSSAAPTVAGALALVRQIRPNLDYRLARHLIARSCDMVHRYDRTLGEWGGWRTNGAGFNFNNNYGFGLLNADRLVKNAMRYNAVSPTTWFSVENTSPLAIPDNGSWVYRDVSVSNSTPIESIALRADVTHTWRGDIRIVIQSPSGTLNEVCSPAGGDDQDNFQWWFTSHAFWGENPQGTWRIWVQDVFGGDAGTLNSLALYGEMGTLQEDPSAFASTYNNITSPTTTTTNASVNVNVSFRNTGTTVWTPEDGFQIGTIDPEGNTTWGQATVQMVPDSFVMPTRLAQFSVRLKAPATPGTYPLRFRMMRNGTTYFGASSPVRNVVVNGTLLNSFVGQTGVPTAPIAVNSTFTATLTFRNTGTASWTPGEQFRLISKGPDLNSRWGVSTVTVPATVAPGGDAVFTVNATAPSTPGNYTFNWRMSKGAAQFGVQNAYTQIRVQ